MLKTHFLLRYIGHDTNVGTKGGGMLKYILHLKEVLNGIEEDIDAECFEKIKNIVLKLEKEAREELGNNTNIHD